MLDILNLQYAKQPTNFNVKFTLTGLEPYSSATIYIHKKKLYYKAIGCNFLLQALEQIAININEQGNVHKINLVLPSYKQFIQVIVDQIYAKYNHYQSSTASTSSKSK